MSTADPDRERYEQIKKHIQKEDAEHAERVRRIKEIEAMKYPPDKIGKAMDSNLLGYNLEFAQAMIAFNQLCNQELDRLQ